MTSTGQASNSSPAPVLACPADISTYTDINSCTAFISGGLTPGYDPSEVVHLTWELSGATEGSSPDRGVHPIESHTFNEGHTLVTYRAVGSDGSATSCTFDVTISDNQVPRFEQVPGNIIVATSPGTCAATVYWPAPVVIDNCTPSHLILYVSSARSGDEFPVGMTTVTCRARDAMGNESMPVTFTVTVEDREPPQLMLPPAITTRCGDPLPAAWQTLQQLTAAGGSATDNCSPENITFRLLSETKNRETCPYTLTRVYQIADAGGNTTTAEHRIVVEGEGEAPELKSGQGIMADVSYTITDVTCNGGNDGKIDLTIENATGELTITWSTSNGSGIVQGQEDQTALKAGDYTVVIDDDNPPVTRNITVNEPDKLTPGAHNTDLVQACQGYNPAPLTFTTPISGGKTPYSYQWLLNDENIGETTSSYDSPQLIEPGKYSFTCIVTDDCGDSFTTQEKIITIIADPVVSVSGAGSVCQNQNETLTASYTGGTGTFNFQWQTSSNGVDNWTDIINANQLTYTPPSAAAGTYYYRFKLVSTGAGCNNPYSNPFTFVVYSLPTAEITSADLTICEGGLVNISGNVVANGSWSLTLSDGSTKTGTGNGTFSISVNPNTTTIYTISSLSDENCGAVESGLTGTTTVTVVEQPVAPALTKNPNLSEVCEGQTLTASVTAGTGGAGNIADEYRYSTDNGTNWSAWSTTVPSFNAIEGINLIESRRTADGTGCTVSSSNQVSWTVVAQPVAPALTKNPNLSEVCEGQTLSVSVTAGTGGAGNIADEYRYSTNNGSSWTAWSTTVPSFAAVTGTNIIESRRTADGTGCTVSSSNQVSWTVVAQPVAPALTKNPNLSEVCEGQTLSVSVTAGTGGAGNIADEYRYSTDNGTNWSTWSTTVPTFNAVEGINLIESRRIADGTGCTVSASNQVSWTVAAQPEGPTLASKTPGDDGVCVGQTVSATFNSGSGGVGCSDEFQYSFDGTTWVTYTGGDIINTTGQAGNTLVIQGRRTNCDANSGCSGTEWTTLAEWEIYPLPTATISGDATICEGGETTLFVALTGSSPWNIVYRRDGSNDVTVSAIATSSHTFSVTEPGVYTVYEVSDANSCSNSGDGSATVTLNSVTAGVISGDQVVCLNGDPEPFTETTPASGSGLTYRWERALSPFSNWNPISGATSATFDPGPLTQTTQYRRIAISTLNSVVCESEPSNTITVTVQGMVNAGSIGTNQTICNGETPQTIQSTANGTGSGDISYEWEKSTDNGASWAVIENEYNADYSPGVLTQTTLYRRRTISTIDGFFCKSAPAASVAITVQVVPGAGVIAGNETVCYEDNPQPVTSASPGSGSGTISYLWESYPEGSGWALIPGETSANYDPGPLTVSTSYRRTTVSTLNGKECQSAASNVITKTVQQQVDPGSIGTNHTICYEGDPNLLTNIATGSGSGDITYLWESSNDGVNWTSISGAVNATYDPPGPLTVTTHFRRVTISTLNNVSCEATSTPVAVTVNIIDAGEVGTDHAICYEDDPELFTENDAATGEGTRAYQWQKSNEGCSSGFEDINGATSATYNSNESLTQTTYYRRKVTFTHNGQECTTYSNCITVTVYEPLVAPEIQSTQIVCIGSSPDPLEVVIPATGGSENYSYQWQRSNNENGPWNNIGGATNPNNYSPNQTGYYRLIVIDQCGTEYSNIVQVSLGLDLGGTFDLEGRPSNPVCPGYNFTAEISSISITGLFGNIIRFSWSADPDFVEPPSGGPVGTTERFWFITWFEAEIPFTLKNETSEQVTTIIYITPSVRNSSGNLICNLSPVPVSVTIRPFKFDCSENITAYTSGTSCSAQVPVPNITWVPNSCTSAVNWTMSGATTGNGTGNLGTRTFNKGITTVTYTSTLNGQTTECSFDVEVIDNQPPQFTCPGPAATYNTDPGNCTTSLSFPVTVSDCDPNPVVKYYITEEGEDDIEISWPHDFPVGTTTVKVVATDNSENNSECSFDVVVVDNQDPEITCPTLENTYNADEGMCSYAFDPGNPTVTDNCLEITDITWEMTGATEGASPETGKNYLGETAFNVGTTTVTYTATDPSGNFDDCSFEVVVADNQDPYFTSGPTGYSEPNIPGECFAEIVLPDPVYYDNCGVTGLSWSMSGSTTDSGTGNIGTYPFPVGETMVSYTIVDAAGNDATWNFSVQVQDSEAPEFDCPESPQERNTNANCSYIASGTEFDPTNVTDCGSFTIENNLTGTETLAGYEFPVGTTSVTWFITDDAGNQETCSFNVVVTDNEDPVITACPADLTGDDVIEGCNTSVLEGATGFAYSETEVELSDPADFPGTATDNCGIVKVTWRDESAGSCPTIVTRTWTVSDAENNSDNCQQIIHIDDTTKPNFTFCPTPSQDNTFEVIVNSGNTYIHDNSEENWDATATDNCGAVTLVAVLTGATTSTEPHYTSLDGVTFNEGTTTVTWTATDACGNTDVCTFDVEVIGQADIAVTKALTSHEGVGPIAAGDEVIYTITVTNNGPATAGTVTLTDVVPAAIQNPQYTVNGGTSSSWSASNELVFNDMSAGSEQVIVITGTAGCPPVLPEGETATITNTATVALAAPLTDPDTDNNTATVETDFIDNTPPTFTQNPPDFTECVENLSSVIFNGDADNLEYNPNYPEFFPAGNGNIPGAGDGGDYYIFVSTDTRLDLDLTQIGYSDNCCGTDIGDIEWTIEFDGTEDYVTGTGQPSSYGTNIYLWGDGVNYQERNHTITYFIYDCHGNKSNEIVRQIVIQPRPKITKVP